MSGVVRPLVTAGMGYVGPGVSWARRTVPMLDGAAQWVGEHALPASLSEGASNSAKAAAEDATHAGPRVEEVTGTEEVVRLRRAQTEPSVPAGPVAEAARIGEAEGAGAPWIPRAVMEPLRMQLWLLRAIAGSAARSAGVGAPSCEADDGSQAVSVVHSAASQIISKIRMPSGFPMWQVALLVLTGTLGALGLVALLAVQVMLATLSLLALVAALASIATLGAVAVLLVVGRGSTGRILDGSELADVAAALQSAAASRDEQKKGR